MTPRRFQFKKLWILLPIIGILAGLYLLFLVNAPALLAPKPVADSHLAELIPENTSPTEPRVYIPRLNLNLEFSDSPSALDDGLWHRHSQRGNPEDGGNFILAGHRLQLAPTPHETVRKSPLYHVDQMKRGDHIYVDFQGKRYIYEVTATYTVKPQQIEIEAPSTQPKMTLYTCTINGESDGRDVIEARQT